MAKFSRWCLVLAAVGAAGLPQPAAADGMPGSTKQAAPEPARDWKLTGNLGAATDYVFRGFSQSAERPSPFAGADLTYKWLYAGFWAAKLDFGDDVGPNGGLTGVANTEIDWYAGVKVPVWKDGELDLGLIYYTYPGAFDHAPGINRELDYVEAKVGLTQKIGEPLTVGATLFYCPEHTNRTGEVLTIEGRAEYALPKWGQISPTVGALVGRHAGDDPRYLGRDGSGFAGVANGKDNYLYWNAGISFGFGDNFSIDLRYWDTNVPENGNVTRFCTGQVLQCDERFVGTAKITF